MTSAASSGRKELSNPTLQYVTKISSLVAQTVMSDGPPLWSRVNYLKKQEWMVQFRADICGL